VRKDLPDLFFVAVKPAELAQKLYERALPKRVVDGGVEGQGRVLRRESSYPFRLESVQVEEWRVRSKKYPHCDPRGYQIALVQDEHKLLVRLFFFQKPFDVPTSSRSHNSQ
jgi:hypothetical protein